MNRQASSASTHLHISNSRSTLTSHSYPRRTYRAIQTQQNTSDEIASEPDTSQTHNALFNHFSASTNQMIQDTLNVLSENSQPSTQTDYVSLIPQQPYDETDPLNATSIDDVRKRLMSGLNLLKGFIVPFHLFIPLSFIPLFWDADRFVSFPTCR